MRRKCRGYKLQQARINDQTALNLVKDINELSDLINTASKDAENAIEGASVGDRKELEAEFKTSAQLKSNVESLITLVSTFLAI